MNIFRVFVLVGCVLIASQSLQAQTSAQFADTLRTVAQKNVEVENQWKLQGNLGVNFTQVGLKNWAGGGKESIGIFGLIGLSADYKANGFSWNNSLDLGYGMMKLGTDPFRKSDDKIILTSQAGLVATKNLRYSALLDFRTQFAVGRNYDAKPDPISGEYPEISNFLAPAYLMTALGIEYKPADYFSVLLSPLSGRTIIVNDDNFSKIGAFGVEPGEKTKVDFGGLLNAQFKKEVWTNVSVQSRLNVFSRYSDATKMVVNSETQIGLKVNDFLNVSLGLDIFYDDRITITRDDGSVGPTTQIRNVFALGFGYKFGT